MNELRKTFLEFFESKGHLAMKSFSLAPHNSNSLLLISSGMAPLKPYFTRQEIPPRKRVTTYQKCTHTSDIENIGKMARHGAFFEILGNFSFGDYFKTEAVQWSQGFLTEVVDLGPDRLYPFAYLDGDEAFEIWDRMIDIPAEQIPQFGKKDNFWEHGVGPCGPCSKIYYDRGEECGCDKPDCTVGCECDRYMEIQNNAFTQFRSDGKGNYTRLSQKNIDTGMGPERLVVAMQKVDSLFTVDAGKAMIGTVCELAHTTCQSDKKKDMSLRIIADHMRFYTFMIPDGVMPSDEGCGYVLRRLLRRAMHYGRILGTEGKFIEELSRVAIELSENGYPELEGKQAIISKVVSEKEDKLSKTIDQGMTILSELEEKMSTNGKTVLSGEDASKLYDTYGFSLDLTIKTLEEKNFTAGEKGFKACMKEQRKRTRTARKTTSYMRTDVTVYQSINPSITTTFIDYDRLVHDPEITVLTTETDLVQALTDGESGTIIVEETPFYGTMGGQQTDIGVIVNGNGEFQAEDTIHPQGGKVGHVGYMVKGMFQMGDTVTLKVYGKNHLSTGKDHSATHLLQRAPRLVLSEHMEQAGSYVDRGRFRFDFTHLSATTPEEIVKVEELMNREIKKSLPVVTQEMSLDEAKESGVMTLFGEKYDEKVCVVKMGDFPTELCGSAHVTNTGVIRVFKILFEIDIAAGVRRIEALTGDGLMAYHQNVKTELHEAVKTAKTTPAELKNKTESILEETHALHSENEKLKSKLTNNSMGDVMNQAMEIKGVKMLAMKVADVNMNGLRSLGNQLKEKLGEGVMAITSVLDGKVNLVAAATGGAQKKGVHAGNLIKAITELVGGSGGGHPSMAQTGSRDPVGVEDTLAKVRDTIDKQIRQS